MNPLFEKYLLGEISEAERASLEQELKNNPELRIQFEKDRAFMESLQNVMLRRTIKAALSTPDTPQQNVKSNKRRLTWIMLPVVLLFVSWLVWNNFTVSTPVPPDEMAPPAQVPVKPELPATHPPGADEENKQVVEKEKREPGGQMAQASIAPHSLRGLRGNGQKHTPWADLVVKIWDAPFLFTPASFGERYQPVASYLSKNNTVEAYLLLRKLEMQSPGNDTLAFLKGYCLMQMWEGEEAWRYFSQISDKQHPWVDEVQWYEGLCHLLTGEKVDAIAVFMYIAGQKKHPYRSQAAKALKLLR